MKNFIIIIFLLALIGSSFSIKEIYYANVSKERKVFAFMIRYFHAFVTTTLFGIIVFLYYQLFMGKYNIKLLLALNVLYFIVILCFTKHKMCILTIWYNNILNRDKCYPYIGMLDLLSKDSQKISTSTQEEFNEEKKCQNNLFGWLKGNQKTIILLLILNATYLFHNI